jgi:cytochrome c oxidase subunit I
VNVSLLGGVILLVSALLFVWNLWQHHREPARIADERQRYAVALHNPASVPAAFNGFRAWNWVVLFLMAAAYGYPIAQFFIDPPPQAVVHRVD